MVTQTQTQYDRNIRTAYVAIDAMQSLADRGALPGSSCIERAMEAIREVISAIDSTPIRTKAEGKE